MKTLIKTEALTKSYPGTQFLALDNLTLEVKSGECYGFLGANGAGKSTTIRLLLNFIQPTSGTAKICDYDVTAGTKARTRVGYLSGDVALYHKPTGKELLDFLGELQGTKDLAYRNKLEKRFSADLNKPISALSKGNRQKIGIIQAFMHQPDVLILDEPTSGLDPLMQEAFYETVRENTKRGAAVFMSSHNLYEAQRVCDKIGIIKQGKLIHEQEMNEASALTKTTYQLELNKPAPAKFIKEKALKIVNKLDDKTFLVQAAGEIAPLLSALGNYDVREFSSKKADLEDEFLEFYGETK